MNLVKKVSRYNVNQLMLISRNFGALCKTIKHDDLLYSINTGVFFVNQNKANSVNVNCSRNFSLESFVAWQGKIYAGISNSYLVHVIQDGLLCWHEVTGLPWWAAIVTSTVLVRAFLTLPLTVYQNYILAKVENISLELKELMNELTKETILAKRAYKLSDKQTNTLFKLSAKKQWQKLIVRDNCHPFKASLVLWFQIPVWVCMSFALRNLVNMQSGDTAALVTLMEMSMGGIGWIPNLTEPDHSFILPVAFGLTNLAIIEIQRVSKLRQPSKFYNFITNGFRLFSIVMIPVAANVPSCMCLYWITSSSFGLIQNLVLLSPPLRRKLKIPETLSELEDPYGHMKGEIQHLLQKITFKK